MEKIFARCFLWQIYQRLDYYNPMLILKYALQSVLNKGFQIDYIFDVMIDIVDDLADHLVFYEELRLIHKDPLVIRKIFKRKFKDTNIATDFKSYVERIFLKVLEAECDATLHEREMSRAIIIEESGVILMIEEAYQEETEVPPEEVYLEVSPERDKCLNDINSISVAELAEKHGYRELLEIDRNVQYPWEDDLTQEAPEDASIQLPVIFEYYLNHFSEEHIKKAEIEFDSLFESHISKDFRESTNIEGLLKNYRHVFIPYNWNGIKMKPWHIETKENLPAEMVPKRYWINPNLLDNAKTEVERLSSYFLEKSYSSRCSPMVVAPKATTPFIRICGDYRKVNEYIKFFQAYIPNVQIELQKISKFKFFIDVDLANAFHQIPIDEESSELLSIMTPWGAYKPKFLPEGINVAPGILQSVVQSIFKECAEWLLVIFDNLLILGDSYEDLYEKMEKVLKIAEEHNLQLKFAKTFLGFPSVKFFGFICEHNKYRPDPEKAAKIELIQQPKNRTEMQSYLGHGQMYAPHVKNYSLIAAPLTEMTKKDFNWKDSAIWNEERTKAFNDLKEGIRDSYFLYYPNYEWQFILVVDASKYGCAGVLYQVNPDTGIWEPIACVSHKFSQAAQKWSAIDQEAYGNYWPMLQLQKYLLGKHFILYTDHFNLLYIERSIVPRIMRMKVFMQQFNFLIGHIKGKLNVVADYWSRIHYQDDKREIAEEEVMLIFQSILNNVGETSEQRLKRMFKCCHSCYKGNWGARTTYDEFNKQFPGHRIPYSVIADMVATCPICQKIRLASTAMDSIQPQRHSLLQSHHRRRVGIDLLTITPVDNNGNKYLWVIVVINTKLTFVYPSKDKSATSAARALFQFYTIYGLYEEISCDPGKEFTAGLTQQLNEWFGVKAIFSIVDRHESNGVEGTNKQILRHLRALVSELSVKDRWSDIEIIGLIIYILNSHVNSETGFNAYQLHFGREENTYFKLPEDKEISTLTYEYLMLLEADLKALRAASHAHMEKVKAARLSNNIRFEDQNQYQPGDLILIRPPEQKRQLRSAKLNNPWLGPYEVIKQDGDYVHSMHITLKTNALTDVSDIKIFHSDPTTDQYEEALQLARIDRDQQSIESIRAHCGNPFKISTMKFELVMSTGQLKWEDYDANLALTEAYNTYIHSKPTLHPLRFPTNALSKAIAEINTQGFPDTIQPGVKFYLDLRYFDGTGEFYLKTVTLPDKHNLTYVYQCEYVKLRGQSLFQFYIPVTEEYINFNVYMAKSYGSQFALQSSNILIDYELCRLHPYLRGTKFDRIKIH